MHSDCNLLPTLYLLRYETWMNSRNLSAPCRVATSFTGELDVALSARDSANEREKIEEREGQMMWWKDGHRKSVERSAHRRDHTEWVAGRMVGLGGKN